MGVCIYRQESSSFICNVGTLHRTCLDIQNNNKNKIETDNGNVNISCQTMIMQKSLPTFSLLQ